MNIIDLIIILWGISAVTRGYRIGLLRQVLSLAGFIAGLLLGSWIAPFLTRQAGTSGGRLLITILCTLGLGILLASLAEMTGQRLQRKVKFKPAHTVNSGLGMAFSLIATLFLAWLLSSAVSRLPLASAGLSISESKILAATNKVMPPAPAIMNRLGRLISPHGFPQVFVGDEPFIDPAGPPSTPEVDSAAAKALASTVRIEGSGCGGVSVGSGFVAGPGYVVTNAHVVAGIRNPIVMDQGSRQRSTVVWFDPDIDFAVLKTGKLSGPSLPLASVRAARGTSAAVLGYPGGGRLTIDPAVVLDARTAVGRDIYDSGISTREIYSVQANIEPGNSGGPMVLADGSVAGVMFGTSLSQEGLSYALTAQQIAGDLRAALTRSQPVSTGPCVSS